MPRLSLESSVVGAGTRVTGRVTGEGSLRIEGQVKGELHVSGPAEIGSGGSVEGNISADSVEIAGSLLGDVSARGPVAILAGALVRGDLRGTEVSIEPGSRVSVRIDTELELELAPRAGANPVHLRTPRG